MTATRPTDPWLAELAQLHRQQLQLGRRHTEHQYASWLLRRPQDAQVLVAAAQSLSLRHRFRDACSLAQEALAVAERNAQVEFAVAQVFFVCRQVQAAMTMLEDLNRRFPGQPVVLTELAVACQASGAMARASEALNEAIGANPRHVPALHEKVLIARIDSNDPVLERLADLARNAETLLPEHQVRLHYALGKALDDVGDFAGSFKAFATGAAIRCRIAPQAPQAITAQFERNLDMARAAARAHAPIREQREPRLVFIIGMPRSGSTLLERQLLERSHASSVGETPALAHAIAAHLPHGTARDAASVGQRLSAIRADYLDNVGEYVADLDGHEYILDKTTTNFVHTGLVGQLWSGAKVLHCQRDALDTCWSLFSTWFGAGTNWSYDLDAIASAYIQYTEVMATLERELPGQVHEVSYEAMVTQNEATLQSIVEHIGPGRSAQPDGRPPASSLVMTPSFAQVRRPIYQSSLGHSRVYRQFLTPLVASLKAAGIVVPD